MPSFQSTYLVSSVGYSGRVAFSSTSVSYFVPLIHNDLISITNSVTGLTANFDKPAVAKFPLLFTVCSSAACRIRTRTVHPSVNPDTSTVFTLMTGSAGYSNVAASTDLVQNTTLASASVAAGTTNTSFRVFDVIRSGSYGAYLPANTIMPIIVTSYRDCWLQITARDAAGAATTGELIFTLVSDLSIVGY